jgi:hypothetical protein
MDPMWNEYYNKCLVDVPLELLVKFLHYLVEVTKDCQEVKLLLFGSQANGDMRVL